MDESKHSKCEQVRELLSELAESAPSNAAPDIAKANSFLANGETAHDHVETCSSCRKWLIQTTDLVNMAQALPQFDVSEGLTQSIMRSVEQEDKAKQYRLSWLVYGAAISLFFYVTLFVDGYESVWGLGSWVVGLATMVVLKLLIAEPKREKQVI